MKCGICGETKYRNGGPFYDRYDLDAHKKREHPDERKAQLKKMRDGKARAQERRDAAAKRRLDAMRAVDKPVIDQWWKGKLQVTFLSFLGSPHGACHPHWATWNEYKAVQAQITMLFQKAELLLQEAYDTGTPVTKEEIDAIHAIGKAAYDES